MSIAGIIAGEVPASTMSPAHPHGRRSPQARRHRSDRSVLAGRVALAAASFLLALGVRPAPAVDCDGVLKMHGFLRRASAACGFTEYDRGVVEDARSCFETLGARRGADDFFEGAGDFGRLEAARPRGALCAEIGRRFPTVVR